MGSSSMDLEDMDARDGMSLSLLLLSLLEGGGIIVHVVHLP